MKISIMQQWWLLAILVDAETLIYVIEGRIRLVIGKEDYIAVAGDALYFDASEHHQLFNVAKGQSRVFWVATNSYL